MTCPVIAALGDSPESAAGVGWAAGKTSLRGPPEQIARQGPATVRQCGRA
ncbi:hypothetical protein [Streptomyces sp. NPDC003247]